MRRHTGRVIKSRAFKAKLPSADPNRPGSPHYAHRHRQFSFEPQPGMRRIDIGSPVQSPGRKVQQVPQRSLKEPVVPVSAPVEPPSPDPSPERPERDWRKEYGLGSDV